MLKSLEIVNHDLEICEKGDTNFGFMYKNELKQIKADLEVLEIIKKKYVDIKGLKHTLKGFIEGIYKTMEEVLNSYNLYFQSMEEYLTLEELLKLKQWLEQNKVGDNQ